VGRQRGAALVLALLIFAISAALIVAMRGDFERVYQRAGGIFFAEQSEAYLRGAEGLASLALLVDYDQDKQKDTRQDTLQDIWARKATPYPLDEGGWLAGDLEDLQGRFNLNLLAARPSQEGENPPRFTPAQAQFIRLLIAVGEPEVDEIQAVAITQAVGDWEDTDSEPRPDGAEDDYYAGLTPAYRAANRPMASVSELRAVRGVTPEIYQLIAPWVTVWPQQGGTLNIHTAPVEVLRSLGPSDSLVPLSESDAVSLVGYRCSNPYGSLDEFLQQPAFAAFSDRMDRGLLGETSEYFLLRAQADVAGRSTRLYSVLQRENRQISVLSRTTDARASPQDWKRDDPCES